MHADHLRSIVKDLKNLPQKIGMPILAAWNAKEDLMDLLALTRTKPDRTREEDRGAAVSSSRAACSTSSGS